MTTDIVLGCPRQQRIPRFSYGAFSERETDRSESVRNLRADAPEQTESAPSSFRMWGTTTTDANSFRIKWLPVDTLDWLDTHTPGWKLIDRFHFPRSLGVAASETVLRFPTIEMARSFQEAWHTYLASLVVSYWEGEAGARREVAEQAFACLVHAERDKRLPRARDFIEAAQQVRFAEKQLREAECERRRTSGHETNVASDDP